MKTKRPVKKERIIFGRELSEDGIVKALRELCKQAGVPFIPSKKRRKS